MLIRDGDRGEGDERVKARPKKTGETVDRRQNNRSVKAVSPRHCPATSALRNCCLTAVQDSHKDNVCCTAVEEQPEAKEVQLSQPSSTSLLIISSGRRVQLHLPALDLTWTEYECGRQNPSSLEINYPQSGSSRHILPTGKLK